MHHTCTRWSDMHGLRVLCFGHAFHSHCNACVRSTFYTFFDSTRLDAGLLLQVQSLHIAESLEATSSPFETDTGFLVATKRSIWLKLEMLQMRLARSIDEWWKILTELTQTDPASSCLAIRLAWSRSSDQTDAPRPILVLLARATTSSSSLQVMRGMIGPNGSSVASLEVSDGLSMMVGVMK
jgi:hypothetical protein